MRSPKGKLLLFCLAVGGLALNLAMAIVNHRSWNVDFNSLYVAGKLAGTGHLFDWAMSEQLQLLLGPEALPSMRIPVVSLAFRPISQLAYPAARMVWFVLSVAVLCGAAVLWPSKLRRTWVLTAVCWSAPAAMCLALGQDTMWFLLFATVGLRLLLTNRDFWAGAVLSLCVLKPHLAVLLPVMLAAQRRWRAVAGGLAGGAVTIGLSFASEGRTWVEHLLAQMPLDNPEFMPNLRGLGNAVGAGPVLEMALGLFLMLLVWAICRRLTAPAGVSLALAGGLLLSHHAYYYDAILLLPALGMLAEGAWPEWLRNWALLLITPIPYMVLLTPSHLVAQLAITGFVLALGVHQWTRQTPAARGALTFVTT